MRVRDGVAEDERERGNGNDSEGVTPRARRTRLFAVSLLRFAVGPVRPLTKHRCST